MDTRPLGVVVVLMPRRLIPAVMLLGALALPAGAAGQTATLRQFAHAGPEPRHGVGLRDQADHRTTRPVTTRRLLPRASRTAPGIRPASTSGPRRPDRPRSGQRNGHQRRRALGSRPRVTAPVRGPPDLRGRGRQRVLLLRQPNRASVQPTADATQSFPVSLPVENNLNPFNGLRTQDYIGVSGVSGAGALPLVLQRPEQRPDQLHDRQPGRRFLLPPRRGDPERQRRREAR